MDNQPTYNDGLAVLDDISALDLNNGQVYSVTSFKGGPGAQQKKIYDSDGEPQGSQTQRDFREQSIELQYALETDEMPEAVKEILPGHVFLFRGRYYVAGKPDAGGKKGEAITVSLSLLECQNPVFPGLLSQKGDFKEFAGTVGVAWTATNAAVNTRTGAAVTYSLSGAPAGVAIVAATGAVSWAAPVLGDYKFKVVALDVLTGNPKDRSNAGKYHISIKAA